MRKSFQDQLLKLGLADKKKSNEIKKKKHQQKKQKNARNKPVLDENAELARKALEKKKNRAQELNRQREEKLQKREDAARIKQLIEKNHIAGDEKGIAYRFTVGGKIRRIFVHKEVARQLANGALGIVGQSGKYEIIPAGIIGKIRLIDKKVFTVLNERTSDSSQDLDDPYAAFQVPDDLMW